MKLALEAMVLLLCLSAATEAQQITATPSTINAYSQGATSAPITFSGTSGKRPVEACWCGELIPAAPDIGMKCNPATVFGCLPVRYDQSRQSSASSYTDILTIPASVARRAYTDAASGADATFFYVRRFVSLTGGPDEFVPITIRLSGNGAGVPLSLTDVKLAFSVDKPVVLVKAGEKLPEIRAEIKYTGTGRLKGRWEIVKPGDELPTERDLLTEATLPVEERALQRRYTEMARFNVYLPPGGRKVLAGPETWRLQNPIEGMYLVLLRIEAADDNTVTGSGKGGPVAGFAMPTLRYFVGSNTSASGFSSSSPVEDAVLRPGQAIEFAWTENKCAAAYRLEVENEKSEMLISAIVLRSSRSYRAPSWFNPRSDDGSLRWRVVAVDEKGRAIGETGWRRLRVSN